MKKFIIFITALVVSLSALVLQNRFFVSAQVKEDFVKGEVLVKFKATINTNNAAEIHKKVGARVKETISGIDVVLVETGTKSVGDTVSAYAKFGGVEFAEPNFIATALTNDEYYTNQWALNNTGQETCNTKRDICTTGTTDADIDAQEAWGISTGSAQIKIAILDSGIDQDHPDLAEKIIGNIDFSGSGSVDDFYGHGTHVAGIASALTDNSTGVAGVGFNTSLLNVKVLGNSGSGSYSAIANGIDWAVQNGAKVINMSLGSPQKSSTLELAVNYAWENGVVVVAAAGNSNNPSRTYPAYYENCIAVAATDNNDVRASFSSYGSWVDVAAPGVNIYSTFPNHPFYLQTEYGRSNNYDFGNGASMSVPHVSGIAALVWANEPGLDNISVRSKIEQTSDRVSGTGTYWIWGRVNACNAVGGNCSEVVAPTPTPTSAPDACYSYCFKKVCDGVCHPAKEGGSLCPDCS